MIKLASDRVRELSRQPFIRPGGVDFDIPYAMAVWDARDTVWLEDEVNAHPGEAAAINLDSDGRVGQWSRGFVPAESGA
jgi:hypothetical protein